MIYFLGYNLSNSHTGVEKAQFNRLKLFEKYGIDAKLIYVKYNANTKTFAEKYGIKQNYLFMYEYLQESDGIVQQINRNWIEYWEESLDYKVIKLMNTTHAAVYKESVLMMYASFRDGENKSLEYVNYYDRNKHPVKRDIYDERGFLSCTCYFYNNRISSEYYYTPRGELKFEKYYIIKNNKINISHIIFHESFEKSIYLNSESELITYFLQQLYQTGDQLIIDRPLEWVAPFAQCHTPYAAHVVLHTAHFKFNLPKVRSNLKPVFNSTFNNVSHLTSLVVSTTHQKNDLTHVIDDMVPVHAIPVGHIEEAALEQLNHKIEHQTKNSLVLISFARYAKEKQLNQQIRLIDKLRKEFPAIELRMFGTGLEKENLLNLVKELKLERHVIINDFTYNVEQEFENAILSLSTSYMEGFSLAIMESLANGVPVIAYDVDYGPSELIHHAENGELLPLNNEEALYRSVKSYLLDSNKQQFYRRNCLKYINNFSDEKIMDAWLNVLKLSVK